MSGIFELAGRFGVHWDAALQRQGVIISPKELGRFLADCSPIPNSPYTALRWLVNEHDPAVAAEMIMDWAIGEARRTA